MFHRKDELRDRINQGRELMGAIQDLISKEEEWNPRLERRYENAMMAVQKLEERLQKLYAFNASSASIFSEYESCLAQLNTGISAIANSGAWNASSGTFDVQKMDMRWAKPITTRWQAREKMRQEKLKKAENEAVNLLKKHGLSKADLVQKTDSPEVIAQKYIRFSKLGLHPHTGEALPKEDCWKFQYAAHSNTLFETLGIAGGAYAAQKAANAGFYTQPNALAGTKNGKQYTLNKGQSPKGFKTFKKASGANVPKPNVGVTQSRINIANGPTKFSSSDNAGFNHVVDRHFNPNRNAGQFTISQDKLKSILSNKNTVNIPVKEIPGNQFERIVDIGEIAGTVKPSLPNVGGQSTNYIRIITDKAGNLVTTYPIPKP